MTGKLQPKKNNKAKLTATIIVVLTFSAILVSVLLPFTTAQPNSPHEPSNMDPMAVIEVQLTDLTFSDDEPLEDDKVIISVTLQNNGSIPLENISLLFYLDMEELGAVSGISIKANGSLNVNYTWPAEKWEHTISVVMSIDGTPLKDIVISKEISVEAKPIGDILTLVFALVSILVVVLVICCIPSILRAIRG